MVFSEFVEALHECGWVARNDAQHVRILKLWDDMRRKAANQELVELVDGAYEIVEIFNATTQAQIEWKRAWLEKARKHGASGE